TGSITEPAALQGSTRCVGLRVEPEDDVLAALLAQLHRRPVVGLQGEVGRSVTDVEEWHASFRSTWAAHGNERAPATSAQRSPSVFRRSARVTSSTFACSSRTRASSSVSVSAYASNTRRPRSTSGSCGL